MINLGTLTKWYIHFPLELLLSNELNNKEKVIAIDIYYRAHGKKLTNKIESNYFVDNYNIKKQNIKRSLDKISKVTNGFSENYIKYESIKGKNGGYIFTVINQQKNYQMIPDYLFDNYSYNNVDIIINYAKLRYSHWYCTYKDGTLSNDSFRIAKVMGLKSEKEYRRILNELIEQKLIIYNETKAISFNDGLDDKTLTKKSNEQKEETEEINNSNDSKELNNLIKELTSQIEQLRNECKQKDELISSLLSKLEQPKQIEQDKINVFEEIGEELNIIENLKNRLPKIETQEQKLEPIEEDTIEDIIKENEQKKVEIIKEEEYVPGEVLEKMELLKLVKDNFYGYGLKIRNQHWNCDSTLLIPKTKDYEVYKKISNDFINSIKKWYDYEYVTKDYTKPKNHIIENFFNIATVDDTIFQETIVNKFSSLKKMVQKGKIRKELFKFIIDKLSMENIEKEYTKDNYMKVMKEIIKQYNNI